MLISQNDENIEKCDKPEVNAKGERDIGNQLVQVETIKSDGVGVCQKCSEVSIEHDKIL